MVMVARSVLAVIVGVLLGLVITAGRLDSANRSVKAGPWLGAGREGAGEADPYTLAAAARRGLLPLGAAEGLSFIAETDNKGGGLNGRCEYAVTGPIPAARFWSISVLRPGGFPVANPAERYGFTSADILRMDGEPVTITVAPDARSGNWLPSGRGDHFLLLLRLYDTGLSTVGAKLDAATMPKITRVSCR